ncbi:hypothetical protein ES288_D06G239900v1 [Gossypium darwinii]|uniref:Uncharacterized protein n=1 Tax=Gossypium darwinii TaxID=34276 RepID=A0A5D2C966_GOSDA|nr:hypothetical protein ES288_D06G239900v1 [Gossypium darwinii]
MGVLVRPELYGSEVDLFELVHGFAGFHKREGEGNKRSSEALLLSSEDQIIAKNPCHRTRAEIITATAMHQPVIEPGSVPWQGTILPLDHWCLLFYQIALINTI